MQQWMSIRTFENECENNLMKQSHSCKVSSWETCSRTNLRTVVFETIMLSSRDVFRFILDIGFEFASYDIILDRTQMTIGGCTYNIYHS